MKGQLNLPAVSGKVAPWGLCHPWSSSLSSSLWWSIRLGWQCTWTGASATGGGWKSHEGDGAERGVCKVQHHHNYQLSEPKLWEAFSRKIGWIFRDSPKLIHFGDRRFFLEGTKPTKMSDDRNEVLDLNVKILTALDRRAKLRLEWNIEEKHRLTYIGQSALQC